MLLVHAVEDMMFTREFQPMIDAEQEEGAGAAGEFVWFVGVWDWACP